MSTLQIVVGIVSLASIFAGVVAGYVTMKTIVAVLRQDFEDMKKVVETHVSSTLIHIDPVRDEARFQELLRRLDRFESKLDNLNTK